MRDFDDLKPLPPGQLYRSLPEILSLTFQLYRANFRTFAGIVVIVSLVLLIVNQFFRLIFLSDVRTVSVVGAQPAASGDVVSVALFTVVSLILETIFINGTLTYVASEANFGNNVSIVEAFEEARKRYRALGGALVVGGVALLGGALLVDLLVAVLGVFGILFTGALVYAGITLYFFLVPVFMLEDVTLGEGFLRSWGLGRTQWWGTLVLVLLISLVASLIITQVAALLTGGFTTNSPLWIVAELALSAVIVPILPIAITLKYYDIRIVTEGIDEKLKQAGEVARPSDLDSPLPTRLFTGRDALNILAVTFGLILIAQALLSAVLSLGI